MLEFLNNLETGTIGDIPQRPRGNLESFLKSLLGVGVKTKRKLLDSELHQYLVSKITENRQLQDMPRECDLGLFTNLELIKPRLKDGHEGLKKLTSHCLGSPFVMVKC